MKLPLTLLLIVTVAAIVSAQNGSFYDLQTKTLLGKDGKKSEDVSGIARATLRGLRAPASAGDTIPLIGNKFEGEPLELDGEG